MSDALKVVLCWHMHQPWYRESLQGAYRLPWVYLHAIKDYSDMAAHLEHHPNLRAVVNFAPVLLEQLDDYATQLHAYLQQGTPLQDRLLNLLAGVEPIPATESERRILLADCQRCYAPRMIDPYPPFANLLSITALPQGDTHEASLPISLLYLSEQYFMDIVVWYHLVWLGTSMRHEPIVQILMAQQGQFSERQRHQLLTLIHDCLAGLIPRYRALAERGQIELAMSPYMHPIVPLLHDFNNMRDALPDAPAPQSTCYPSGHERARWHMQRGIDSFVHYFGQRPQGVWLSEGGISEDTLPLLDEFKMQWTASGEGVWRSSCARSHIQGEEVDNKRALFQAYQHPQHQVRLFFRDDGLSDLIGFKYSQGNAEESARDFTQHLVNIAQFLGENASNQVVSVILDGENAWEYYPDNGYEFLDALYRQLSTTPAIEMTTFNEVANTLHTRTLPRLSAGSWVYGSFSTWIGSPDKNKGWDYLVAAKQAYDQALVKGMLTASQHTAASQQLAVCEGSDWFWWFGDYNPSGSVSDFEALYRQQLRALYTLLGLKSPDYLNYPLSYGGGQAENAGTMRRNAA